MSGVLYDMSLLAYFMVGDLPDNFTDTVEERSRRAGLEIRQLRPESGVMQIDYADRPCMHYILGCGRSDYAFEADSIDKAMSYANIVFDGFVEEACIMFQGFCQNVVSSPLCKEKEPERLSLF